MDSQQRDARAQHSLEDLSEQEDPEGKHHCRGGKAKLQSKAPAEVVSGPHSNILPVLAPPGLGGTWLVQLCPPCCPQGTDPALPVPRAGEKGGLVPAAA